MAVLSPPSAFLTPHSYLPPLMFYLLQNDDWIAAAFLLSFVLLVWAVSRSWAFLEGWVTGFFNEEGTRKMFTKRVDVQLNGYVPILVSVSLLLGILVTSYMRSNEMALMSVWGAQNVHLGGSAVLLAFILLKMLLYFVVNRTFFSASSAAEWTRSYTVTLLIEGGLLLPLVVATVFLELSFSGQRISFFGILGIVEILRLMKLKVIFFRGALGYVHIFLYFCTLNLATTFIGWQVLTHIKLLDTIK